MLLPTSRSRSRESPRDVPNEGDATSADGADAFLTHPEQWELYKRERPETAAEEIAAAIVFLCSERASYVAGAAWSVDGGTVAIIV